MNFDLLEVLGVLHITLKRTPTVVVLCAVALAMAIVPASGAAAQTGPANGPAPLLVTGVCGTVSAFTAPTTSATGTLTITDASGATQTFTLASGATITGLSTLAVGSSVCFFPGPNTTTGSPVATGTITANTPTTLTVCGVVTGLSATQLNIGGATFNLATGATFTGGTPTVGTNTEIALTVSPLGTVTGGAVAATPSCTSGTTTITGAFTNYAASVGTTPASFMIGPQTFYVAPGVTVVATSTVLAASTFRGRAHVGSVAQQRAQ